jgi:hypothetical protein
MAAVEADDMKTAQRMVNDAAKAAGFDVEGFHGTHRDFTVFNRLFASKDRIGLKLDTVGSWFTDSSDAAKHLYGPRVMRNYLSLRKPLVFDGIGGLQNFRNEVSEAHGDVETFREWAKSKGYDGVEISGDFVDGELQTLRIVFDPSQIKSADSVTYDDQGNIIPPSKRFNDQSNDIRESICVKESVEDTLARIWEVYNQLKGKVSSSNVVEFPQLYKHLHMPWPEVVLALKYIGQTNWNGLYLEPHERPKNVSPEEQPFLIGNYFYLNSFNTIMENSFPKFGALYFQIIDESIHFIKRLLSFDKCD